jgi:protein tyrosine/serine phosphatase
MNIRRIVVGLLALVAAAVQLAHAQSRQGPPSVRSAYGQRLSIAGIPNAGKVTEQLYRGAQPRDDGIQELKKIGISTIVDLRGEDPVIRASEKKQAEALGMRFVSIPVGGWSPPTNDQVAQFLALFGDNSKEKVFVHCHYGEDRTGVFVATYRIAHDKWAPDQTINEMLAFGFRRLVHPAMMAYVRDFPALLTSAPALSAFAPAKSAAPAPVAAR